MKKKKKADVFEEEVWTTSYSRTISQTMPRRCDLCLRTKNTVPVLKGLKYQLGSAQSVNQVCKPSSMRWESSSSVGLWDDDLMKDLFTLQYQYLAREIHCLRMQLGVSYLCFAALRKDYRTWYAFVRTGALCFSRQIESRYRVQMNKKCSFRSCLLSVIGD